MKPELILQSDLLDIIFEDRNKEYGAYALRSQYNRRLKKSMAIIFSIFFLATGLLYIKIRFFPPLIQQPPIIDLAIPESGKPEVSKPGQKTKLKPEPLRIIRHEGLTKPLLVQVQPVVPPPGNTEIAALPSPGKEFSGGNLAPGDEPGSGGAGEDSGRELRAAEPGEKTALRKAEIMPEFPGGPEALHRFLIRNLRPMDGETEPGAITRVLVQFVVDRDGSITGIEFEQSGGRNFDNEVLRVMKKMPAWKPGMQNGRAVAVYFRIPVIFQSSPDN